MTCVFKEYVLMTSIPSFYGMEFPSDAEMKQASVVDASGYLKYVFDSSEKVGESTKYIYLDTESNYSLYFVVDSDGKFVEVGGDIPGSFFVNICYEPVYMEGCKEKNGIVINPTETGVGGEYVGISTDEKPVGVPKYSIYWELDTGDKYYFDGSSWNLIPSGGGGGGASAFNVTLAYAEGSRKVRFAAPGYDPTYGYVVESVIKIGDDYYAATEGFIDAGEYEVVPLFDGGAGYFGTIGDDTMATVTGDASIVFIEDIESYYVKATGPCTITVNYQ